MKKLLVAMMVAGVMTGCSTMPENNASQSNAAPAASKSPVESTSAYDDLYVADYDGRINVFYDVDLYKDFLKHGETPFRRTFIGAGPHGKTLVYGLTKADKKKTTNPAEEMMKDGFKAPESFYGEVFEQESNRFYVFTTYEDFKKFVDLHVDNLRYTDIGSGPNGETVVYVLNEENKKKKPEAAIARFKSVHDIK